MSQHSVRHILSAAIVFPLLWSCFSPPPPNSGADMYQSQIQWAPYTGKKMRLVVTDFENRSGYGGTQFARAAQKMLGAALTQSGHFDVFEGDALYAVLAQQGFQNSGLVNASSAVKVGGLIGAQFVVLGAITELGETRDRVDVGSFGSEKHVYRATIDVSVVNVQTGQTIISDTQTALVTDKSVKIAGIGRRVRSDDSRLNLAIRDAIDKIAVNLVEKTPTSGFDFQIASIDENFKVAINAGAGDNMTPGQQLRVYHKGAEIKDPATGEVIGYDETEIGVIEVVEVKAKLSYCRIISGRGFQVGDIVRP